LQYVSPVIDGFDFGVGFAPNNSTPFDGSGCSTGGGGVGCATQSSSTLAGDYTNRYRNEIDGAIRYRNSFGPIGFSGSFIWTHSGVVNAAVAPGGQTYNGLDVGDAGTYISIFKQLELGGNIMWGAVNNVWAPMPSGGHHAFAWVTGVKYTMPQFPATVGAYYFKYTYQGTTTGADCGFCTQRTSQGLDVGAVYGFGPGVVAVAEYAWGQVYQGNVDLLTGTVGSGAYNTVNANVFTLGMSVRF
ncbi:MAG TPA: hypothetical protein VMU81_02010, partial [Acetobacteraceae bacterium]|nr:hypothetical protein [Acetobacteraceae bacterium]